MSLNSTDQTFLANFVVLYLFSGKDFRRKTIYLTAGLVYQTVMRVFAYISGIIAEFSLG